MRYTLCRVRAGFTLIEVLVVIGIIAVLAGIVLVAVNPSRQFKLARDSQRTSNVNAILNAIQQNMAEHKGVLVCEGETRQVPSALASIESGEDGFPGDIASCIVPDYISALPFDPSEAGAHFTSMDNYRTGYRISKDEQGRITVAAGGELTGEIAATR